MRNTFAFKDAARFPQGFDREAGARRLGELLEAEGDLSTASIIRDARRKGSPLHSAFTWDPNEALEKTLQAEADYLRRSLVVVTVSDEGLRSEIRAVVPVVDDMVRRYIPTVQALSDPDYRGQVLAEALRQLQALRRKYRDLQELARVFSEIDRLSKKKAA